MTKKEKILLRQKEVAQRLMMCQSPKAIAETLQVPSRTIYRDIDDIKATLQQEKSAFYVQVASQSKYLIQLLLKVANEEAHSDPMKALVIVTKSFELYKSTLKDLNLLPAPEQLQEQTVKIDFINPWGSPIERIEHALHQLEQDNPEKYKSLRNVMLVDLIKKFKTPPDENLKKEQQKVKLTDNDEAEALTEAYCNAEEAKANEISTKKEIKDEEELEFDEIDNRPKESNYHLA